MPLIQVDLDEKLYDDKHAEISTAIHKALVDTTPMAIPEDDLFQVFRKHAPGELVFDPTYNNLDRQNLVLIQVTMVHRYPAAAKREMFINIAKGLAALGIRPEDLLISILQNEYEDWLPGITPDDLAAL